MFAKKLGIMMALLFASQSFAVEYLVKYKDGNQVRTLIQSTGVRYMDHNPAGKLVKVDLNESTLVSQLAGLATNPNVEYMVPNVKVHAFTAPVDTQALKEQWAIVKVNAQKAWNLAKNKGNKNTVVAVIDTGTDYNHESLKQNMVQGYNFIGNNNDPMDITSSQNPGHGTHCAGIIGATGLVDGGTIGISPEIAIMPLRFLDENGSGDLNNGIKAIDYAIQKGVKVISASWGATIDRQQAMPLVEAVKRASDAGVIFVVAAANDGSNNDQVEVYPANASFENTISVAASGPNDEKPNWSNYGKASVHLASPGLNIMSTLPGNKYNNLSGTSMATPLVSGLVGLLKSQMPQLSGAEIKALLQATGAKVSIETACNCRVDAGAAMEALLNKQAWLVPTATTIAPQATQAFKLMNASGAVKFESTNTSVATINDQGLLTAVAEGETQVKATDASGKSVTSLSIYVGKPKSDNGGGGGGNPGDGSCPLGNPQLCEIICQINPDMPFCKK